MADLQRPSLVERDIDQAIVALKKGAHLLKYGRRGKPKFCPFRLSNDETTLIWYYGKDEKRLELCHVTRIIPGQRTPIFQRYPRPEKEYQSFSLIYGDRSLDLICKDKDEAEVWFAGLKALIARDSYRRLRNGVRSDSTSSESPRGHRVAPSSSPLLQDQGDNQRPEITSQSRLGKAFADIVSYTASANKNSQSPAESITYIPAPLQASPVENSNARISGAENIRVSLSSAVSSSSQGSCNEDFNSLGDVFIWGESTSSGVLGGSLVKIDRSSSSSLSMKNDALLPKALESTMVLDVHSVACGQRHAVLVTKQGEIFSWGEESGGRLGHGLDADVPHPKLIETLSGKSIEMVACGDFHTCAVTLSGDLYTWGDGSMNCGLLGHGSEASHWVPKKVGGPIEGLRVTLVACGPWHTALLTSSGRLFTFGDGTFGALGHGDRSSNNIPREVESLKGSRTLSVSCGVWHSAAIVEEISESSPKTESDQQTSSSSSSSSGKLFTWGDGDKGRLGHSDKESRLLPQRVALPNDPKFLRVACGDNFTLSLTSSGRVYFTGTCCSNESKKPACVKGDIAESCVTEITCGSNHIAILTSKAEVYTWGKGSNGQLGHGDSEDRNAPTLVTFLKDKQVKSVACGSNFTAVICVHKWISSADNSVCSGCRNPFNFRRKRHNCYNCGLVFCKACSARKSLKASLAPSNSKPYRVCDDCFNKLQKNADSVSRVPNVKSTGSLSKPGEPTEKESGGGSSSAPRLISRLSSVGSFKSERGSGFNFKNMVESGDNRMFSIQRTSTSSKSPTSPYAGCSSQNFVSFSAPDSRVVSRSPSPVLRKSSLESSLSPYPSLTCRTSEASSPYDVKSSNDSLIMEVKSLRAQVQKLTGKSQLLEAELERKSKQLNEALAKAAEEAEKSKAAKEMIKFLKSQLKEMSGTVPEAAQAASNQLDTNEHTNSIDNHRPSNGSIASTVSPKSDSSECSGVQTLSNGIKLAQAQKIEQTIQDEPGVYITMAALSDGSNELRRVRFSRKCFTEEQAEKWWAENGTRVCDKHNIRIVQ